MTELVQMLRCAGWAIGSVYALLALGFVIIYKSTRVISFAQPAFMLAGAVLVTYLVGRRLLPGGAAGRRRGRRCWPWAWSGAVLRPMVGRPAFTVAIITLGIDVVIRVFASAFIGHRPAARSATRGDSTTRLLGVEVQQRHLA